MTLLQAVVLGIVEGITEFLPISSTGHMILVSSWMGIQEEGFVSTFEIAIQLGAIAAIVFRFAPTLLTARALYSKLLFAFLPAAVLGFLVYPYIKAVLFGSTVVAFSLIIGGVVLIGVDTWYKKAAEKKQIDLGKLSNMQAVSIGLFQSVSMIPGVSRAAATILGGLHVGLSKKQAMEFSFLLAVPTMIVAAGYDLYKTAHGITGEQLLLLGIGSVVAAVSAWFAVGWFVGFVEKKGFAFFGFYRIFLGLISLWYFGM